MQREVTRRRAWLLGGLMVLLVGCILVGIKEAAATQGKLNETQSWPIVTGVITQAQVSQRDNQGFCPRVRYSYTLGATVFHSSRVRSSPEGASFCTHDNELANAFVRPYEVGKPVAVHYDPRNPEHSTLEVERATLLQAFPKSALAACFVLLAVIVRQGLMAAASRRRR